MKKDIIAIDLHGTLLNEHWQFPDELVKQFHLIYKELREHCEFYLCTGNDLSFLNKHLSREFLSMLNGFILETGAVYFDGQIEKILIDNQVIKSLKELEVSLKAEKFSFIRYFAERKASISMFTHTETEGENPEIYYKIIKEYVDKSEYSKYLYVTYSNVAIDIIPKNISKYSGIKHISGDRKIISLLDSMNDYELAINSDLCFLPSNSTRSLLDSIQHKSIEEFNQENRVYLCNKAYGEAVIEALALLTNSYY